MEEQITYLWIGIGVVTGFFLGRTFGPLEGVRAVRWWFFENMPPTEGLNDRQKEALDSWTKRLLVETERKYLFLRNKYKVAK